jgi:hypothetical protein
MRKENQEIKREIQRLRKYFKNREKKWEEEKKGLTERQLERKIEHEQRRTRKNNIVITGWRGEGKSKQQIKT